MHAVQFGRAVVAAAGRLLSRLSICPGSRATRPRSAPGHIPCTCWACFPAPLVFACLPRGGRRESCASTRLFGLSTSPRLGFASTRWCDVSGELTAWRVRVRCGQDEVWYVQFSHEGTQFATASKDQTVIVWQLTADVGNPPAQNASLRALCGGCKVCELLIRCLCPELSMAACTRDRRVSRRSNGLSGGTPTLCRLCRGALEMNNCCRAAMTMSSSSGTWRL